MTDQTERKAITFEVKADAQPGQFSAAFATFNVRDAHDDVTRPGAFRNGAEVLVGAYNHETGFLPVGKGTIHSDDSRAWIEGEFNLNTQAGRDHYEAVKHAGALMEWSYIYRPTAFEYGEHEGKAARFLNEIEVWSVDPVLKGAGVGTGTLGVKSGMTFKDHTEAALTAVLAVVSRAKSLSDLRASKGKELTDDARDAIAGLLTGLDDAKGVLSSLVDEPGQDNGIDLSAEALRFEAMRASGLLSA